MDFKKLTVMESVELIKTGKMGVGDIKYYLEETPERLDELYAELIVLASNNNSLDRFEEGRVCRVLGYVEDLVYEKEGIPKPHFGEKEWDKIEKEDLCMTREEFIKGIVDGNVRDNDIIRYCKDNIVCGNDELDRDFLKNLITDLWVENDNVKNDICKTENLLNAENIIVDYFGDVFGEDVVDGQICVLRYGRCMAKEKAYYYRHGHYPDQQTEPQQESKKHVTESKTKKKRGRPQMEFEECIVYEDETQKQKIKDVIKSLLYGKKGRAFVDVIQAAIELNLMTMPTYNAISEVFGKIGSSSNYYRCMGKKGSKVETYKNIIKQKLMEREE
ncbi:MAG: hypothetical protein UE068_07705 [Paludibacteraceae bacterium]|nr:hypothetical protein [Paludibacteraceae bacterium]